MYQFNAVISNSNTISITTNTYWSCKSEGNFKLSAYDGSGTTTIDIIIPDDIMVAEGIIYFSYGDDRCKYPDLSILSTNNCLIKTTPSYIKCDDNSKILELRYDESGELFNVSIMCVSGWSIFSPTLKYFETNDGIVIVSGEEDDSLFIQPNAECDETNFVEVRLIKNPD